MLVRSVSRDVAPTVILAKAQTAICHSCIFWSGHSPAGPCGGFTRAIATGTRGETHDIKVIAGDGFIMDAKFFAKWAQGPGKNGRKKCSTNTPIDG